jgi:hypothetical protein
MVLKNNTTFDSHDTLKARTASPAGIICSESHESTDSQSSLIERCPSETPSHYSYIRKLLEETIEKSRTNSGGAHDLVHLSSLDALVSLSLLLQQDS